MKRVLGLDWGSNSIGWTLVDESEGEDSKIVKLGVQVIQYDTFSEQEDEEVSESKNPVKDKR